VPAAGPCRQISFGFNLKLSHDQDNRSTRVNLGLAAMPDSSNGLLMSTDAVEMAEGREGRPKESLAERLAMGPLPLLEALRYAREVAAAVRDLHRQGVAHGAVSSQLIMLGESGAALGATSKASCLGDRCLDVKALGEVLDDMLGGGEAEGDGSTSVRHEMQALALRCRNESLSIQQVLIYLRLLALLGRQSGMLLQSARGRSIVSCTPKLQTRAAMPDVRFRIRLALHSKPLARLVFGLLDKIT
jgi:hypothetical protein